MLMYSIEITSDIESWFAQPTLWNSLSRGVPFRETSWLASWWKHLGCGLTAQLVIARNSSGDVCGLLPLYRDGGNTRGRTLRLVGDGNACTDDASVLAHAEDAEAVAEAIGRYLVANAASSEFGWDVIDLDGVVAGDEACQALARGLRSGGATLHSHSRMNTWFKSTTGSWEDHLGTLSKSRRRAINQFVKKLDFSDGLEYVPAIDGDVPFTLDRLIEMHQARWIAAGELGTYAEIPFRDFIHAAVQSFGERGMLMLPTLRHEGRIIAGELHFVGGNSRMYCYSTGYDIAHADLEPGRMLNVQVLRHAYAHEHHGVDLMRGDEQYKVRMNATPRKLLRVRVVAPAMIPQLFNAAWRTRFEFKQWMRRRSGRKLIDVVELDNRP